MGPCGADEGIRSTFRAEQSHTLLGVQQRFLRGFANQPPMASMTPRPVSSANFGVDESTAGSQMSGASSRIGNLPRLTELQSVQADLEYALSVVQQEIRDAGGTPKPRSRTSGAFTARSSRPTTSAMASSRPSTGALGGGARVPRPPSTGRLSSVPSRNTPLREVPRVSEMESIEEDEQLTWEQALWQRRSVTARSRAELTTPMTENVSEGVSDRGSDWDEYPHLPQPARRRPVVRNIRCPKRGDVPTVLLPKPGKKEQAILPAPNVHRFHTRDTFETTNRKDFDVKPPVYKAPSMHQGPFNRRKMPGYKRPTMPRHLERKGRFSKEAQLEVLAGYRKRG